MNRLEFMKALEALLSDISQSEREEALQYYNDYLNDAGVENEQEVLDALGTPQDLARVIKEGLSDSGEKGEFTETGYKNKALGEELKNEIMQREMTGKEKTGKESTGKEKAEKEKMEKEKAWKEQAKGETQSAEGKQPLSPGMIILIVILCIIAFPALAGIAAGVIGTGVGILGGILGIIVGVAAAGIALLAAAGILLVVGITTLFTIPLAGICFVGLGLLLAGLAMFFIWLTIWICAKVIPALIRGIVKIGTRLLRGKGANKL